MFIPGTYTQNRRSSFCTISSKDEDYVMVASKLLLPKTCTHCFQLCIIVFKRPLLRNYRRIGLPSQFFWDQCALFPKRKNVGLTIRKKATLQDPMHYHSFCSSFVCSLGNLNVRSCAHFYHLPLKQLTCKCPTNCHDFFLIPT